MVAQSQRESECNDEKMRVFTEKKKKKGKKLAFLVETIIDFMSVSGIEKLKRVQSL